MMRGSQIIRPIYDSPFLNPLEKILLRKRMHWLMLILPVTGTILFGILFIIFNYLLFATFTQNIFFLISLALIIILITSSVISKLIVDWHCHFYILTNRRILEVCYKPLFANHINNVILNQVKSTEIDIEKKGLINHLFDMGNVLITFDRPTHQEEFCFMNIKDPRSVGFLLADVLDMNKTDLDLMMSPVWYKSKNEGHPFKITEEIFPGSSLGAI